MTAQGHLIYEELSYKIRGCLFKVYNSLGSGHKESVYNKALTIEFGKQGLHFELEKNLDIFYGEKHVGNYRPDFVIEGKVLLEIKAQDMLTKNNESQLLHYLKSTNFALGLLVNFGSPRLDIRRKVWTSSYPRSAKIRYDRRESML